MTAEPRMSWHAQGKAPKGCSPWSAVKEDPQILTACHNRGLSTTRRSRARSWNTQESQVEFCTSFTACHNYEKDKRERMLQCLYGTITPKGGNRSGEVAEPRYSKKLSTTQEYSARQRTDSAGSVDDDSTWSRFITMDETFPAVQVVNRLTELCTQNSRICIHKIISKDSTIMKRREMHTDTAAHTYAVNRYRRGDHGLIDWVITMVQIFRLGSQTPWGDWE